MSKFSRFMKSNKTVRENGFYAPTKSLRDENGKPLEWEFRHITSGENEELRDSCTIDVPVTGKPNMFRPKIQSAKYIRKMIAASVVVPDLYDAQLQDSYGVMSPEDLLLAMVDDPYNCLTLCSGSLNANPANNVAEIIYRHCDRIAFAHIRNVKHFPNGDFSEASHRDCDGDTGILDIVKAYHDCGFKGYIRPDHGRHLWNEGPGNVRPGYGLYDRALGVMYMLGIWDMLDKLDENKRMA